MCYEAQFTRNIAIDYSLVDNDSLAAIVNKIRCVQFAAVQFAHTCSLESISSSHQPHLWSILLAFLCAL